MFERVATIGRTAATSWHALKNRVILNERVIITDQGDIHPFRDGSGPVFKSKQVLVEGCDKNFICYWVGRHTFPKALKIVLDNHPCDQVVFNRYSHEINRGTELLLPSYYRRYYEYWASQDATNIQILESADFKAEIAKFKGLTMIEEPLIFEDTPESASTVSD